MPGILQMPQLSVPSLYSPRIAAVADEVQLPRTAPHLLMLLAAAGQAANIHRTAPDAAAPDAAAEQLPGAAAAVAAVVTRSLSAAVPHQALRTECSLLVPAEVAWSELAAAHTLAPAAAAAREAAAAAVRAAAAAAAPAGN